MAGWMGVVIAVLMGFVRHADGANGLANVPMLAGIGDSLMLATNAKCKIGICISQPDYSFLAGTCLRSVRHHYATAWGVDVHAVPVLLRARVLSQALKDHALLPNAASQAYRLCEEPHPPERVVVALGSNDVCLKDTVEGLPSVEEWGQAMTQVLDILGWCLPWASKVHVLTVPHFEAFRLQKVTQGCVHRNCRPPMGWPRCVCNIVTNPRLTTCDLKRLGAAIEGYNHEISQRVAAANRRSFPKVIFSSDYKPFHKRDKTYEVYGFTNKDLSRIDCFHPSVSGQCKIACRVWHTWEGDPRGEEACRRQCEQEL